MNPITTTFYFKYLPTSFVQPLFERVVNGLREQKWMLSNVRRLSPAISIGEVWEPTILCVWKNGDCKCAVGHLIDPNKIPDDINQHRIVPALNRGQFTDDIMSYYNAASVSEQEEFREFLFRIQNAHDSSESGEDMETSFKLVAERFGLVWP